MLARFAAVAQPTLMSCEACRTLRAGFATPCPLCQPEVEVEAVPNGAVLHRLEVVDGAGRPLYEARDAGSGAVVIVERVA